MTNQSFFIVNLFLFSLSSFAGESEDWRQSSDEETQLKNLIEVIPSTSEIMFRMGERYKNLYWAAKQGKWEFAEYQVEEMQGLIETLMITRPKRNKSAQAFLATAFTKIEKAVEAQNWDKFQVGFETMRSRCITCHNENDHAFIVPVKIPAKGTSPALD